MLELNLDFQPAINIALGLLHALMPLPDEWDIAGYILVFLFLARKKLLSLTVEMLHARW
jgi:hypothetical protein